MQNIYIVILLIIAYLLGSVNSGILIARLFYGIDIREFGSKGAGATNTLRTLGTKAAAAVFILDILKPVIMISIARVFFADSFHAIPGNFIWLGLATIVGQAYPLFFGFKGGKGAASTLGTIIAGYPATLPFAAALFILILILTKYVSLSTMTAIIVTSILVYFRYPGEFLPYICIAVFVVWCHRANIARLLSGTESKVSVGKKE